MRLEAWPQLSVRSVEGQREFASRRTARAPRYFFSDAIFFSVLILVCALSVFIGVARPLHSYAHDTFFLLDNAYRVVQGQVPHRDFSSAWGPVMFLIDAGGLIMSGMRPTGLGYANAVFGFAIAVWAFLITRARWSSLSACVVGLYTILLISAPFSLGHDSRDFSYAMIYNRYGYAIFGIIMIECASVMMKPAADTPQTQLWFQHIASGGFSTGFALGLLTFLKISYGLVAAPFVAGSLVCAVAAGRGQRVMSICTGFLALAFPVLCYLRFDIADMMQDLMIAAAARRGSLEFRAINLLGLIQAIAIFIFAGFRLGPASDSPVSRFARPLFALMALAAGYLLLISNQQHTGFPLNGYAAVALAADFNQSATKGSRKWSSIGMASLMILLLAVCLVPPFTEDGRSLASAAREHQWPNTSNVTSLASTERGAFLFFRPASVPSETTGSEYVEAVNDGLALIQRHSGARRGVLTFDEFNPFNYLLNLPPPRGGFAAAAYNYLFSEAAHPKAERFLGDTRYVMVRKYRKDTPDFLENDATEMEDVDALVRIYGPVLRSKFSVVEETDHWVLWEQRQPSD
jgi:hypothetical protein